MNQLMVKQLKSRYGDVNFYKKFLIGVDITKFKLYDVDESVQGHLDDAGYTESSKPGSSSSIGYDYSELKFD
jgi:hypothetical protein